MSIASTLLTIPVDLRLPGAFFEFKPRGGNVPPQRRKSLIIAPMDLTNGDATVNTPYLVDDDNLIDQRFGRSSIAAVMARMFRKVFKFGELYVMGLGAGTTAATKTITITVPGGTTAKAITMPWYVDGYRILVPVPAGSDDDAVAAAIEAELDANASEMVATASLATNVVTLTANQLGEFGSDIDVRQGYYDSDKLDAEITAVVADGVAGAGNPALTAAITAMGTTQYNIVALPFTDATSLAAIENELATRWEGMSSVDGHVYTYARGTSSEMTTLGNSRNSKHLTLFPTDASPTPPWIFAAQTAAARAKLPDTSAQLRGALLPDCLAPARGAEFSDTARNTLLFDGVSTYSINDARQVHLQKVITTHQVNSNGFADTSYLNEAFLTNLSTMRYELRGTILLKYPNHKQASGNDEIAPGLPVVTEKLLRSTIGTLYRKWVSNDARATNYEAFMEALIVDMDPANDRVDFHIPAELIKYFDIAAGVIAHA